MLQSKYFKTEELVSKRIFDRLGDSSLMAIPEKAIECLDKLRETAKVSMTINTYAKGGKYDNNGLLCFEDFEYKNTVQNTYFNYFNKQWMGLRFYVLFSKHTAEDAIALVESVRKDIPNLGLVQKTSVRGGNQHFIMIEILGNE